MKVAGKKTGGFTIIEVMFVLAIAGVIMLIVFQAIPALMRSSRNNQRRQDIASILRAVSHYELNNSGNLPSTALLNTNLNQSSKLVYYDPTSSPATVVVTPTTASDVVVPITNTTTIEQVTVVNHAKCDANGDGSATNAGAGYSDIGALYALESGSSLTRQCQQL